MTLRRGALLHKRYRIVEILGEGGMGAVYRAIDENLGVEVAVKENFFTSEEYARQFRREAKILASLRHSNLPRVTDHFVVEDQGQYLVIDYIEGEDLRERIGRLGTLDEEEAAIIGIAICDALTYLHDRNPSVLHRDIKPGNVKITPQGDIFLVDFGLAKVIEGDRETTPGARAMTPGYSPPEQYGTARTDPRTDIYSLAATLYESLTGVIPADGLSRLMQQKTLSPLRKLNPDASRRMAMVLEKALAVNPDDRYQTAQEFKRGLVSSIRGSTRRRIEEGTPAISNPPLITQSERSSNRLSASPYAARKKEIATPFPISVPLSEVLPSELPAPSRLKKRWIFLVVVLGVLAGSALGLFIFLPGFPSNVISAINQAVNPDDQPAVTLSPEQQVFLPPGTATATLTQTPEPTPTVPPTQITTTLPTLTLPPTELIPPKPTATPTITPTPFGGGSSQLVFASDRTSLPQLWVIQYDGKGLRQLTDMPDGACEPDWAPDGSQLVFISPCVGNQEIYNNSSLFIINTDGTGLFPLPTILGGDYNPTWSPDGQHILFTSIRAGNRPQIYSISTLDLSVESLSPGFVTDFNPTWSPDGKKIMFVSTRRGPYQIWTMDADGSNQELFSRSGSLRNSDPIWSPDGLVILFTQNKNQGGVPTLVAARFEEGGINEYRLFPNLMPSREASYSPDGVWVAFESWPDGTNHDIYIMTPNGINLQRLTTHPALDFDPDWQPAPRTP